MSNRTIVEFNHDCTAAIDADRSAFASLLVRAMKTASHDDWMALETYGVRRAGMFHHSDDRKVVVDGKEFQF